MKKLLKTLCVFICSIQFLHGQINEKSVCDVEQLYVTQIDLSETLLSDIRSLSQEIALTWPDAAYNRTTIDFGKVFSALEEGRLVERPIPDFVANVRAQLFQVFKEQLDVGESAEDYDNCIITIYQAGDGIGTHVDRNLAWANEDEKRRYYFGDSVIGLIVEPDTQACLYFEDPQQGEGSRFFLDEKPGTAFLFQDKLRHEWVHGLLPVASERVSMTFRKVVAKD